MSRNSRRTGHARRAALAGRTGVKRRRAASVVHLADRWDGSQGLALFDHRTGSIYETPVSAKAGKL